MARQLGGKLFSDVSTLTRYYLDPFHARHLLLIKTTPVYDGRKTFEIVRTCKQVLQNIILPCTRYEDLDASVLISDKETFRFGNFRKF